MLSSACFGEGVFRERTNRGDIQLASQTQAC